MSMRLSEIPLEGFCCNCKYHQGIPTDRYTGFGDRVYCNKCYIGYEITSETELCTRPVDCNKKEIYVLDEELLKL